MFKSVCTGRYGTLWMRVTRLQGWLFVTVNDRLRTFTDTAVNDIQSVLQYELSACSQAFCPQVPWGLGWLWAWCYHSGRQCSAPPYALFLADWGAHRVKKNYQLPTSQLGTLRKEQKEGQSEMIISVFTWIITLVQLCALPTNGGKLFKVQAGAGLTQQVQTMIEQLGAGSCVQVFQLLHWNLGLNVHNAQDERRVLNLENKPRREGSLILNLKKQIKATVFQIILLKSYFQTSLSFLWLSVLSFVIPPKN